MVLPESGPKAGPTAYDAFGQSEAELLASSSSSCDDGIILRKLSTPLPNPTVLAQAQFGDNSLITAGEPEGILGTQAAHHKWGDLTVTGGVFRLASGLVGFSFSLESAVGGPLAKWEVGTAKP